MMDRFERFDPSRANNIKKKEKKLEYWTVDFFSFIILVLYQGIIATYHEE